MKRPGPVRASIAVMLILLFFSIVLLTYTNFAAHRENKPVPIVARVITLTTFSIPLVAVVINIIFLFLGRNWVYYFNMVMIGLAIMLFAFMLAAYIVVLAKGNMLLISLVGAIYLVPIGLLIWLIVAFAKHPGVKQYFTRSRSSE